MGPQQSQTYQVGSSSPFVGKSLSDINQLGAQGAAGFQGVGFNPQDFGRYLGIDPNTPLSSGQTLNYSGGQSGGDSSMIGKLFGSPVDPTIAAAQKQLQFTQQANQPAIQTLQNQVNPNSKDSLQQRYSDLLDSIKGMNTASSNAETQAVTTGLGARGLMPNSQLGQTELAQGLQPINAAYSQVASQTGLGEQQDINTVNNAIAQLQTGNPENALAGGLQYQGLQNQATQTSNAFNIAQQQLALQKQQQEFQQRYITIPGYGVYDTQAKNLLGGFSSSGLSPSGNTVVGVY